MDSQAVGFSTAGHIGMNKCDQERLVLPMLGLWSVCVRPGSLVLPLLVLWSDLQKFIFDANCGFRILLQLPMAFVFCRLHFPHLRGHALFLNRVCLSQSALSESVCLSLCYPGQYHDLLRLFE